LRGLRGGLGRRCGFGPVFRQIEDLRPNTLYFAFLQEYLKYLNNWKFTLTRHLPESERVIFE
jgi:hypothetical protein